MFMKFNSCELSFFFEWNCMCDLIQVFIIFTFFWIKNTNHVYSFTVFFFFFLEGGGGRFWGAKMRFAPPPHFFDWGGGGGQLPPPPAPPLPAAMHAIAYWLRRTRLRLNTAYPLQWTLGMHWPSYWPSLA